MSESILMSYADVYALTGIPINTQKDWRAKGKGGPRSAVIAGKVKYRRTDVLAWLDAQFEKTASGSVRPAPIFSPLGKRSLVSAS